MRSIQCTQCVGSLYLHFVQSIRRIQCIQWVHCIQCINCMQCRQCIQRIQCIHCIQCIQCISYYHDIVIMWTQIQLCYTLRTPFDIVFNAFFNHGYHPNQPLRKYMFLQICSRGPQTWVWVYSTWNFVFKTRAPRGPPTWVWVYSTWNFVLKTMGYLPRPVDPQQQITKIT